MTATEDQDASVVAEQLVDRWGNKAKPVDIDIDTAYGSRLSTVDCRLSAVDCVAATHSSGTRLS